MSQRMFGVVGPGGIACVKAEHEGEAKYKLAASAHSINKLTGLVLAETNTVQPVTVAVDCEWRDSVRGEDGEHQTGCTGPVWRWDKDNWTNCPYCGGQITTDSNSTEARESD